MQPNNFTFLFNALSTPRVNAYKHYFGQQLTDEQLFGCYQWNESVSHALFKVITLIEIIMRNRMHQTLSNHYHASPKRIVANYKANWQCNTLGSQQSCNWYNAFNGQTDVLKRQSVSKVHTKTHNSRNGTPWAGTRKPSPDDIVSSLSFGFWSSLVDKCPDLDWQNLLKDIFPKHRASNSSQWNSHIERKKLSYRLDLIRDFRNRIAHHEPVWKFGSLLSENPPVSNGQPRKVLDTSPSTPQQSIRRLRSLYSKHLELMKWISKEIHDDFKQSSLHTQVLWLCSQDGLEAHMNRADYMPTSLKPCRFKRELSSILKGKKSAYLYKQGRNIVAIQHIM